MIKVLDHGYVKLVEAYGSDQSIIEAARMSTGKGFLGWDPGVDDDGKPHPGDAKLLHFLALNDPPHTGPFEMGGAILEIQAPIFVFREWHRHRTQSYSEASARYEPLPDVNYVPTIERLMVNANGTNKQANRIKGAVELTTDMAEIFQNKLVLQYAEAETLYQEALDDGVPKELARLIVPVGRYSRMRAAANLLNWTKFLTLRNHSAAQWEIQEYARAVTLLLEREFPRTIALWRESRGR